MHPIYMFLLFSHQSPKRQKRHRGLSRTRRLHSACSFFLIAVSQKSARTVQDSEEFRAALTTAP